MCIKNNEIYIDTPLPLGMGSVKNHSIKKLGKEKGIKYVGNKKNSDYRDGSAWAFIR